jgi:hypothetical protein
LDSISVSFGGAADLKLFLLSQPNPASCLATADLRSYLELSSVPPGMYFLAVDGPRTPGSYAFAVHCHPQLQRTSAAQHADPALWWGPGQSSPGHCGLLP